MENKESGIPQSVEAPKVSDDQPALNTDRDLWREPPGDYYANRIFVNAAGGIGMDVGGHCIVKPIKEWFKLAAEARPVEAPTVRDALKECYVDLAAVLYATTYELAPGVRAQLEKTRKLAEDALAGAEPVEAPLNKWISVEERLPEPGANVRFWPNCEEATWEDGIFSPDESGPRWECSRTDGYDMPLTYSASEVSHWQIPAPPGAEPLPAPTSNENIEKD